MSSTKSKSSVSDTPNNNNKATMATPKVSRVGRGVAKSDADSPSSLQNTRLSVDKSPRSVTSKPTTDRRSPKISTPPDKQPTRALKGPELQAQLSTVQDDLKKAKEKLALVEKEKAKAIDELKEAQRLTEESNEKLAEALVAQKRAEESSEIEKFRAVEMEQAGIEAAQKKEDEWQKELEAVRNQHALDVASLLTATQELQRLKQELSVTSDAKNQALSHAEDATKIAEIHAEKVETLSAEIVHLKALLDSKFETEADESSKLVSELKLEIETLKEELLRVKVYEEKLHEKEVAIEELNVELETARMSESYARSLMEEWKAKVEDLDVQAEEAKRMERSATESLESAMKQLKESNDLLHSAETELSSLKEKVGLLEMSIGRQKGDLEESQRNLASIKEEASEMCTRVEVLKSELEIVKEEKTQALNNEKLAATSVQTLLEEKNDLISELEGSRDEEEKSKKAMESLTSALHEVSSEAREAKEKLLSAQAEIENYESQIEDLKLLLEATNEKYETMLDNSKHEIDLLMNSIEQAKREYRESEAEWKQKELHLMSCIKKSEEKTSLAERDITMMESLLKEAREEASATKEESVQLKITMREAESEINYLKEILGEAKAESMRLKESLMDKENELQSFIQENEELQTREADSLKKVADLSKLLEDAMADKKHAEQNGEISDTEKDYDMLPKVVEFSEQNGNGHTMDFKPNLVELAPESLERTVKESVVDQINKADVQKDEEVKDLNGLQKEDENAGKKNEDSVDVEFKMWESCKIEDNDFSPDRETGQESFEEEVDSKTESGDGFDQINGLSSENVDNGNSSPTKQQPLKKKKPLLHKFGSLLKKKGSSNKT